MNVYIYIYISVHHKNNIKNLYPEECTVKNSYYITQKPQSPRRLVEDTRLRMFHITHKG